MSGKAWKGGIGKGLSLEICKLCKGREEPREDCVSPPASFLTLLRAVSLACSSFPGKPGRSVRYGAGIVLGPQSYTICSITGPWVGTFLGVPYPKLGILKQYCHERRKWKLGGNVEGLNCWLYKESEGEIAVSLEAMVWRALELSGPRLWFCLLHSLNVRPEFHLQPISSEYFWMRIDLEVVNFSTFLSFLENWIIFSKNKRNNMFTVTII